MREWLRAVTVYELPSFLWRRRRNAAMCIVWMLPMWVIRWAVIRAWANATTGPYGNDEPDSVTWSVALKRWDARSGGDPSWCKGR
jgi:hypothetical protein